MANFAYTASKSFTPFTFEQMLKPIAMYTQEYNAIEEGIAELGSKADLMRMYANEKPDSRVATMYNAYANDLDKQAELLAKQGLTPTSRSNLLGLKKRYASEITPIETAVDYRKKVAEEQRKLAASNPNLMFTENFSNISLDRLIDNPELGYSSVSGDDLYKKGAAIAAAASKRIIETNPTLGGQYYAIKEGYGEEAARQFLLNSANIKEIDDALKGIYKEAGAERLSPRDQQRAIEFLRSGALSGMTYKETLKDNKNALTSYQKAQLKAQGLKEDGSIDTNSPIWTMKGYVRDKDGNLREPGKVYNTKDGLVRVSPSGELIKLSSDNTPPIVGSHISVFENASLGKYKKEGTSIPIGPSNKPDLKGTKYEITGNSKDALADKTKYINMVTSAINSGNAIILQNRGGDWLHRPFYKVGKYGQDVPANIFNDFGDNIKFDDAGNIDFNLSSPLEIFEINEIVEQKDYDGTPYDLSKFYIIKVPSSSGTVYVGVPKESTIISSTNSGGYGGNW